MAVATRVLLSLTLLTPFVSNSPASSSDVAPQVDSIFKPLLAPGSPGFAVGVMQNGKLLFARGYGFADLAAQAPITPATDFRLASVTKQFTAMAVMLLVHQGKLRYDQTLTEIFPEFPQYGSRITIRHLLNHTSGLKPYEEIYAKEMAPVPSDGIRQLQDSDVLRILEQQTSGSFAPGERWEYSNSGYAVLAMIVEQVSGRSFADFLREAIFDPLGMNHTVAYVQGKNQVPNRAFGYRKVSDGAWTFSDQSPTSAVLGDGGIYSSIEDMAKWDHALSAYTLLSRKEMEPALTPVHPAGGVNLSDGAKSEYGFGWFLDTYRGHRRMWHDGDTCGFHTSIQRLNGQQLTVVVLANRTDVNPGALALKVADLYLK